MKPIETTTIKARPTALILGLHGDHVDFDWRPYWKRSPEAQKDYDALVVSLFHHGMKMPVITHKGHVLIGMRRVEIMRRIDPESKIPCVEITEDVSKWDRNDIPRLAALKKAIGEVEYRSHD